MTIPFIDLIKSVKARLFPAPSATKPGVAPVVRASKSVSERLHKTVLPARPRERLPVPIEASLSHLLDESIERHVLGDIAVEHVVFPVLTGLTGTG